MYNDVQMCMIFYRSLQYYIEAYNIEVFYTVAYQTLQYSNTPYFTLFFPDWGTRPLTRLL